MGSEEKKSVGESFKRTKKKERGVGVDHKCKGSTLKRGGQQRNKKDRGGGGGTPLKNKNNKKQSRIRKNTLKKRKKEVLCSDGSRTGRNGGGRGVVPGIWGEVRK